MRDIRSGTAGRVSNKTPHMQLMRYRAGQVRAQGGAAQRARNVSLIRQYEADPYPKTKPLGHGLAGKIGMEALDLTTGIPSLVHQIRSMRSQRGNLEAEVQPRNVLPLIAGRFGREEGARPGGPHDPNAGDLTKWQRKSLTMPRGKDRLGRQVGRWHDFYTGEPLPPPVDLEHTFGRGYLKPTARLSKKTLALGMVPGAGVVGGMAAVSALSPPQSAPRSRRRGSTSDSAFGNPREEFSKYRAELRGLVASGQISMLEADDATRAARGAGLVQLLRWRGYLQSNYDPPKGGWAP